MEQAIAELHGSTVDDLLEVIGRSSPTFFETLVLDLLHAMRCTFKPNDGEARSAAPKSKLFYGALAGHRANKGVFITTSTFTSQAEDFARSVKRRADHGRNRFYDNSKRV